MIFYLPIYNRTRPQFEEWLNYKIEKELGKNIPYQLVVQVIDRIEREYGRSWEQNHAIGWIKIEKGQGGFSFVIAKTTGSMRSKKPLKYFELLNPEKCYGGYHTISFKMCNTPDDYMKKFEKIFYEITDQEPFKNCFIDYSQIISIYKHLDWNSLRDST